MKTSYDRLLSEEEIQKLTDLYVSKVEVLLKAKETDLLDF